MDAPVNEEYGVDVTAPSNVSTSLGTAVANFIRQYVVVSISVLLIATVISIFALINDPPTGVAPLQAVVMPIGFSGLILICVLGILLLSWIIAWILGRRYRRFMDLATVPFSFLSTRKPQNPFERILSERNLQPDEVVLAQKMTVLSEIDERVASLRRRTTTILTTMGLSLLGAALVAIFAGRLTSLDAAAVSNIDKLKSEKSEQMRYLANISQFQKNYVRLENARKEPDTDIGRSERELTNFVERVFARGEIPPNDLTSAEELKRTVENQLMSLNTLLADAWKKELESERGYNDWRYIVATAITRVGVILIIVFLVQILLGLYRYNMRLIAYYNANRDMLTVWDGAPDTLQRLYAVLSPPKIDFGKEPKHPLEDIVRGVGEKIDAAVSKK